MTDLPPGVTVESVQEHLRATNNGQMPVCAVCEQAPVLVKETELPSDEPTGIVGELLGQPIHLRRAVIIVCSDEEDCAGAGIEITGPPDPGTTAPSGHGPRALSAVSALSSFDISADVAAAVAGADAAGDVTYVAEPTLDAVIVTARGADGSERRFELVVRELPPPGRIDPVGPIVDRVMRQRPPEKLDFERVPDALNRIGRALGIALDYQHHGGQPLTAAQKDGVIDAMAHALLADEYKTFVDLARDGFDGWQTGTLPVPPDRTGNEESRAWRGRLLEAMPIVDRCGVSMIRWDMNSVLPGTDVDLLFSSATARDAAACLAQKADDADATDYSRGQEP